MKHTSIITITGFYLLAFCITGCIRGSQETQTQVISDSLKTRCVQVLKDVMRTQSKFVKVHAAEYLIWTGHPDSVLELFLTEERLHGKESPYRIGIWRVLIQAENDKKNKDKWKDSLQSAFLTINGKDRVHAAETMAKLKIIPAPAHPKIVQQAIKSRQTSLSLYTLWATASASSLQHCKNKLLHLLTSDQGTPSQRRLATYILRHIDDLAAKEWEMLANAVSAEPDTSSAKVYMLSAAYVTAAKDAIQTDLYKKIKARLMAEAKSPHAGNRTELSAALAEKGTTNDLPILISMLNNNYPLAKKSDNADVRSAAAYAILRIAKR